MDANDVLKIPATEWTDEHHDIIFEAYYDDAVKAPEVFRLEEINFENVFNCYTISTKDFPPGLETFLDDCYWMLSSDGFSCLEYWLRNIWHLPKGWIVFIDHSSERIEVDYAPWRFENKIYLN